MKKLFVIFALAGMAVSFTSCASNCMGKGVNKYCDLQLKKGVIDMPAEDVCSEEEVAVTR